MEGPRAATQRRPAVGKGRPGEAESRLEGGIVVDPLLARIAHTGTEREAAADPDVILEIQRALQIVVFHLRRPQRARVEDRLAALEGVEAGEGVRSQVVEAARRREPVAIELKSTAQRVDAADVVDIRGE